MISIDMILALMNHNRLSTRILFLRFLDIFLRSPNLEAYSLFVKTNGIGTLTLQLQMHPISSELIDALLAQARNEPLFRVTAENSTRYRNHSDSFRAKFVNVCLGLAKHCHEDEQLFIQTVRRVHQFFLSNPFMRDELLRSGLAVSAADAFPGMTQQGAANEDAESREYEARMRQLEDCLIELLKSFAMHGCLSSGVRVLEEIIVVRIH
jgi:hypothetical protein